MSQSTDLLDWATRFGDRSVTSGVLQIGRAVYDRLHERVLALVAEFDARARKAA